MVSEAEVRGGSIKKDFCSIADRSLVCHRPAFHQDGMGAGQPRLCVALSVDHGTALPTCSHAGSMEKPTLQVSSFCYDEGGHSKVEP